MNNLAIILARGGSKRIPRKNLLLVAGKPLVVHSIEQAIQSSRIERVVVSTDDQEIADVSRCAGAEIVRRPADISGDEATSESALLHCLEALRRGEQYEPSLVVMLQPTSPLRSPCDIDGAVDCLVSERADSVFSARRVEGFVWKTSGPRCEPLMYDPASRPRRQDMDYCLLEENGSIYVFRPHLLQQCGSRLAGRIVPYIMHPLDSLQIDEPHDVAIVEDCIARRRAPGNSDAFRFVRLLALDFDGVMTDNRVLVNQDGSEAVLCSREDGLGLEQLSRAGVEAIVISTEANSVVRKRCEKLGIVCYQGCRNKLAVLKDVARKRSLSPQQVAYVGNDVNDLECMAWVGVPIAVADATPEAKRACPHVTRRCGGGGAVREVAEWILAGKRAGEPASSASF